MHKFLEDFIKLKSNFKLIYISHKFRDAPSENIEEVRKIVSILKSLYPTYIFFAPHLYLYQIGIQDCDDKLSQAMLYCLMFLSVCDEMWVFSEESEGIMIEIGYCQETLKPYNKLGNNVIDWKYAKLHLEPKVYVEFSDSDHIFRKSRLLVGKAGVEPASP